MFPLQDQARQAQNKAHQDKAHQDHLHKHDDPGLDVDYDGRRTHDADGRYQRSRGNDPPSYYDDYVRGRPDDDERLDRRPDDDDDERLDHRPDDRQGVSGWHLNARWSGPVQRQLEICVAR
jgi:hypothetical protein